MKTFTNKKYIGLAVTKIDGVTTVTSQGTKLGTVQDTVNDPNVQQVTIMAPNQITGTNKNGTKKTYDITGEMCVNGNWVSWCPRPDHPKIEYVFDIDDLNDGSNSFQFKLCLSAEGEEPETIDPIVIVEKDLTDPRR